MNEEEWNALPQVKMGSIGERLIFTFLLKKGVQCYSPAFPGAHVIDWMGFATEPFLGYTGPIGIEAKTKRHRDFYPDTGVDLHLFNRYSRVSRTMPVLMCFCDTSQGFIYGNYLHALEKPLTTANGNYPTAGRIRFWHLYSMVPFRKLTEEECKSIEVHETRSQNYQEQDKWFYPFSNPGLLYEPRDWKWA